MDEKGALFQRCAPWCSRECSKHLKHRPLLDSDRLKHKQVVWNKYREGLVQIYVTEHICWTELIGKQFFKY
jgi:hypothetical protein